MEEGKRLLKKRKGPELHASKKTGSPPKRVKNSESAKKVRFSPHVEVNNEETFKKDKAKGVKKVKSPNLKNANKKQQKSFEKSTTPKKLATFKKNGKTLQTNADQKKQDFSKKDKKDARKGAKNTNYELAKKAKQLWEIVRCDKLRKGKCEQLSQELHNLVKGKTKELIYAHDTCRVIECLMIVGNEELRTSLFEELKDEIPKLMLSKYAKFFVIKVLKYGTKSQKNFVVTSFYGSVMKYMKHTEASSVVEAAYNEVANAAQRAALTEEFYGPLFRLFKDQEQKTLSSLIVQYPEKKASILSYMKDNLMPMLTKSVVQHSLIHHILNEFLNHCTEDDRKEVIEALRESIVHILHTKDGSRISMKCIWHGTAKDRKTIVKTFKTHVTKICKEEHGHLVLLAIFESVDDTVIVQKIILTEILANLKDIIHDSNGRKVVLNLLSPRDPIHTHPDVVKILEQGDDNVNSKKDKNVRHNELLEKTSKPLLRFVEENVREMIFTTSCNIVAQTIIKHSKGDLSQLFQKISELVAEPFVPNENDHIIENTAGHLFLKHLIKADKERHERGEATLSQHILNSVSDDSYKSWISCNRGCFILIFMIETGIEEISDSLDKVLNPLENRLKKSKFKSADILLKKLDL